VKRAALLVLAGCDQLWGLQHLPDAAIDAAPGLPATVHGTYALHYVENAPSGDAKTVTAPFAPSDVHATVTVDGTVVAVPVDATGAFEFDVAHAGERYSIAFTTPYTAVDYQLTALQLALVEGLSGSPTRTPAPPGTTFSLTVNSRQGEFSEEWGTLGMFSRTAIIPAGSAIGGPWPALPLLDQMQGDRIYYLGFTDTSDLGLHPYTRADYAGLSPPISVQGGVANPLSVIAKAITPSSCVDLTAQFATEVGRLDPALPNVGGGWIIAAVPDLQLAQVVEFPVAYAFENVVADITTSPTYGNPFPYPLAAQLNARRDDGAAISASQTIVPLVAGCPTSIAIPAAAVAVPAQVALDAVAITAQTTALTIDRTNPVTVSWTRSADGDVSYYVVKVYESVNAALVEQHQVKTTSTSALVAPDVFVAGHSYAISVSAVIGYPDAASGDFADFSPPSARADLFTHAFVAH
jgi:hypothetical protein